MSKQKLYWKRVHRLQAKHNCTVKEAAAMIRVGMVPGPKVSTPPDPDTPEGTIIVASKKVTTLDGRIKQAEEQLEAMKEERSSWLAISEALAVKA